MGATLRNARFLRGAEPRFWHPDTARRLAADPETSDRIPSGARRWIVAAWLIALGLAALVIGVHDAGTGDDIAVTIVGTLLLLGGLVLVVGGIALVSTEAMLGRSFAAIGCVLGVVLGVMLAATQLTNDRASPMVLAWAAIAIVSVLALRLLRQDLSKVQRADVWRGLKVVTSVVTIGVLVSAAQFWYGSIYLPAAAPPSLSLSTRLEPAGELGGQVALRGSVTIENTSGTRVNTLASLVQAYGIKVSAESPASDDFWSELSDASAPPQAARPGEPTSDATASLPAQRFANEDARTVLYASKLLSEGTYFEPGEAITVPFTLYVPKRGFDAVRAYVSIAFARTALKLDSTRSRTEAGRNGADITSTPVAEAGWLRDLTRSNRYLRVRRTIDADENGVDVIVSFSPSLHKDGSSSFDRRMKRFYGYSTANAAFELPEWEASR